MAATFDTWIGSPSANAPSPRAAHQRWPIAGADATPTTISPACSSAMSVAQIGYAAQVVRGAVDRIDDPPPRRVGVAG